MFGQGENISEEVIKEINTLIDAPSRDFAGHHRKFYHDHLSILLPVLISKTNLTVEQKKLLVRFLAKNTQYMPENNLTKIIMYGILAGGSAVDRSFFNRYVAGLLHIKTDEYFDKVFK